MKCACGEAATQPLYLHYRRPRDVPEPLAVDMFYVHGGRPVRTCGAPGCEAEAYIALVTQFPDAQVSVDAEPGASFDVLDDDPA